MTTISKTESTAPPAGDTPEPLNQEDEGFIARYLATIGDDATVEVARLAAGMAPPLKTFDAAALIARAITLREESALAIPARRAALLAGANPDSLRALYLRIPGNMTYAGEKTNDHLIAITAAIRTRDEEYSRLRHADPKQAGKRAGEDALLAAIEEKSGRRPDLPCPLETALRWSLTAPEPLPWKVIEAAFVDFLTFSDAQRRHSIELSADHPGGQRREYAQEWVERLQGFLNSPGCSPDGRRRYEQELAQHQAVIAELDALEALATNYRPGKSAFPAFTAKARADYAKYWEGKSAEREDLLFFTGHFRVFWQEHGCEGKWAAVHERQSAAAKSTNKKRNAKYWSDESVRDLVQQYTSAFSFAQRTRGNARGFRIPGRDARDAGEILGAFISVKSLALDEATVTLQAILSHATWRAVQETAKGSAAGTGQRTKTGRLRKPHQGIEVQKETLRACLELIRGK